MHSERRGNIFMSILLIYIIILQFGILLFSMFVKPLSLPEILFATQVLCFFVPFTIYVFVTKKDVKDILPMKPLTMTNHLLIIVISLFIQPTMMLISGIASTFAPNVVAESLSKSVQFPFFITLLSTAVAPSIFEELIFRGVILSEYKESSLKKAIIVNGLFFGLMHQNLHQFLYAFLLGIMLAYFVRITGSVFSSILSHFIINGTQCVFAQIAMISPPQQDAVAEVVDMTDTLLALGAIVIFTIPVIIFLFRTLYRHNKRLQLEEMLIAQVIRKSKEVSTNTVPDDDNKEPEPLEVKKKDSRVGDNITLVIALFIGAAILIFTTS